MAKMHSVLAVNAKYGQNWTNGILVPILRGCLVDSPHCRDYFYTGMLLLRRRGGAEYCDQFVCVCVCVCMSASISLELLDRSS